MMHSSKGQNDGLIGGAIRLLIMTTYFALPLGCASVVGYDIVSKGFGSVFAMVGLGIFATFFGVKMIVHSLEGVDAVSEASRLVYLKAEATIPVYRERVRKMAAKIRIPSLTTGYANA